MLNIWIMDTSAIAPQMKTKPYSHHAFCPKGTVAQSLEKHEQNRAFCISGLIVLQTTPARTSQRLGRTDDRTLSGVGMARGVAHQGAPEARAKGVICAATVLRRMAVADAESSDLALKLKDGTGKQNGVLVWDNPKPMQKACCRLNNY